MHMRTQMHTNAHKWQLTSTAAPASKDCGDSSSSSSSSSSSFTPLDRATWPLGKGPTSIAGISTPPCSVYTER